MSKSIAHVKNELILSFAPFAAWAPHFETELEIIQNHLDDGGSAIILSCDSNLQICEPNPKHDLLSCAMCNGRFRAGINWLNHPNIKHISFKNIIEIL